VASLVDEVVDRRRGEIKLSWVKGHAGNPMNELVDGWRSRPPACSEVLARSEPPVRADGRCAADGRLP